MSTRRIGVAVAAESLTLVVHGQQPVTVAWTRAAGLEAALRPLAARFGASGAVSVAILPPLGTTRLIELPRLTARERRALLVRDVERHFPEASGAQEVEAVPVRAARGRQLVRASRAEAALIEEIERAVAAAGWTVDRVVPADLAWGAAARASAKDARGVIVVYDGVWRAIRLGRGGVELVRRSPVALDAAAAASLLDVPAPNVVVLNAATGDADAAVIAARFAADPTAGLLRSEEARRASAARNRRWARRALLAAAALFLASAGLEIWGLHRELDAVRARRDEIRPAVVEAMAARDAMTAVTDRLATLDSADRAAPRWSTVIAALAEQLPRDAYLSAFRATADTIRLEGTAAQATGVFEALQRAPWMTSVRAEAPIRQESDASGGSAERFALAAQIAHREGTP